MGIRGLQSFMKKHENVALKNHKLMGEKLIIDCSNCSNHIFFSSNINQAYGGDYDQYAMQVEEFFKSLIECNVEPYVICEGGHPTQKFETVYSRFCNKLSTCLDINDRNQSLQRLFPLVGYTVFQNVAQKLGIPVLRCDFEADDEVAALAKEIGAYVLSNDSDFFIYGVPLIIADSLDLKSIRTDGNITYIPCLLFDAKSFCDTSNLKEEMLPLLGSLLSNNDNMKKFYNRISYLQPPEMGYWRDRTIKSVIRWLADQDQSAENVIDKVIDVFPRNLKEEMKRFLKYETSMFTLSEESSLRAWISPHDPSCPTRKGEADIKHCASSSLSRIDFKAKHFVPPKVKWELECTCENRLESNIMFGCQLPPWFIRAYRLGLVTPMIVDMINLDYLFMFNLIEIEEKKSCWIILVPLIKRIRGILWTTLEQSLQMKKPRPSKFEGGNLPEVETAVKSFKKDGLIPELCIYVRVGHGVSTLPIKRESVQAYSCFPTLFEVEKLTESEKRKVFCSVADFKVGFNEELPRNVEFILFSICYWKQTFRADDEENIIAALLMCLIMFCVVDGKCGRVRSHPTDHTVESCAKRVRNLFNSGKLLDPSSVSVAALIQDLTTEECDLANMELLQFHTKNTERSSYNRLAIHILSEFQASFYLLLSLNSVLCFPFPSICFESFLSGTFYYQILEFLSENPNPNSSLRDMLKQNSRIFALYEKLFDLTQK